MEMDLETTNQHIEHHGKMQAIAGELATKEGRHEDAKRCAARADYAAKEGRLLHGTQENSDPNYMIGHQKLIKAAHDHGLVKHDAQEPSQV